MAIARTLRKSYTAAKNADSSGLPPNFPTPCFGVSLLTSAISDPSLLTDCFGISPLTDYCLHPSLPVSQVFAGTALFIVFALQLTKKGLLDTLASLQRCWR